MAQGLGVGETGVGVGFSTVWLKGPRGSGSRPDTLQVDVKGSTWSVRRA